MSCGLWAAGCRLQAAGCDQEWRCGDWLRAGLECVAACCRADKGQGVVESTGSFAYKAELIKLNSLPSGTTQDLLGKATDSPGLHLSAGATT